MIKRISRIPIVRSTLCWIAALYVRLVFATSRWQVEGTHHAEALWDAKQPFILAFWHGRLLMMPFVWRRGVPVNVLISQHADGEFLTGVMRHFSIGTVRGSSKRGGTAALRELVRLLGGGVSIGFTPDGPRGPRMRASEGVVALARMSGAPIIPIAYSTTRSKILGSWDRFLVALPFGRGTYLWGAPIFVADDVRGDALEAARVEVELALIGLTAEADRRAGIGPVLPAEPTDDSANRSGPAVPRKVAGLGR